MLRVDFTSQNYLRNLATGVTKLRAAGPVVQVHFPIVGKTWITTTNDLAGGDCPGHMRMQGTKIFIGARRRERKRVRTVGIEHLRTEVVG